MPQVAAVTALPSAQSTASTRRRPTSSHVILTGLAQLIEGQRRFADEFGLPYPRVFNHECQVFRQKDAETIIREWIEDKDQGSLKFSRLIEDLVEHNLALCAALDGVAKETLDQVSPATIKNKTFTLFGWAPFAWLRFKKTHRQFEDNDYLRHQELVVKAFAKAYSAERDYFRNQNTTNTERF